MDPRIELRRLARRRNRAVRSAASVTDEVAAYVAGIGKDALDETEMAEIVGVSRDTIRKWRGKPRTDRPRRHSPGDSSAG